MKIRKMTANLYGLPKVSKLTLIESIKAGLPSKSIRAVEKRLGLSRAKLAKVIGVPERTLTRRLRQPRLTDLESDRLDRIIRIFEFAVDTLGTEEKASGWLSRQNRALGNVTPLEMLTTERGAREVEDLIGRIAHGIFS